MPMYMYMYIHTLYTMYSRILDKYVCDIDCPQASMVKQFVSNN